MIVSLPMEDKGNHKQFHGEEDTKHGIQRTRVYEKKGSQECVKKKQRK